MQLSVATFNIRNGRAFDKLNSWPLRRRSTAATIAQLDVDLVGLQEVFGFQRRYLARRLDIGRWFGDGRLGGSSGEQCPIAVISDTIEVTDHATRWYGETPDVPGSRLADASFPRIATIAHCRHRETGVEFAIANTHLDEHHERNRAISTSQLAGWLDPSTPAIVLGDFNADADDSAVMGPLVDAGFQRAPVEGGTAHGFTGSVDGRGIDHIWTTEHWSVANAEVVTRRAGWRLPSDHWPVRATLRLTD